MRTEVTNREVICLLLWLLLFIGSIARMTWIEADDRGWERGFNAAWDAGYRCGVEVGAEFPHLAKEKRP